MYAGMKTTAVKTFNSSVNTFMAPWQNQFGEMFGAKGGEGQGHG